MSARLIQYGFTAGYMGDEFWGQTILQKYGYGLSGGENYIIRYSGSCVSRGGLLHKTLLEDSTSPVAFVPFIFARDALSVFSVVFSPNKIRFLQAGRYLLEAAKTATKAVNAGDRTTLHLVAHGFAVGDLVELTGGAVPAHLLHQVVRVADVATPDIFSVQQIGLAAGLDAWGTSSSFTVARVYTLASPYTADYISYLYFEQARDVIRITSEYFAARYLERKADGTWELVLSPTTPSLPRPTGLSQQAVSAPGTASVLFAVTALDASGQESEVGDYFLATSIVDYTTIAGHITVKWDPVPGAVRYNVYRSIVHPAGAPIHLGVDLGYLGTTAAPSFNDRNNIPDFGRSPPRTTRLFTDGTITRIDIVSSGTGYNTTGTTASVAGPGTGARLLPIVSDGKVVAVEILDGGQGFPTTPAITISGAGTGAVVTGEASSVGENFPRISGIHEQRQFYASTLKFPLGVWGSRIGKFNDFSAPQIITPKDSFSFELSSRVQGIIKHLLSTRVGLLAFTDLGVWVIRSTNTGSISATDINAELQTAVGASNLPPIQVDGDIIYAEADNKVARILSYNDFSKNFSGVDLTVFARELLAKDLNLLGWSYQNRPYKVIWSYRNDGRFLSATLSQEEKVYAWMAHTTAGKVEGVMTLPEALRERTYLIVKRFLSGRWVRSVEELVDRELSTNYNHCGVDCAVSFGFNQRNATLTLSDYRESETPVQIDASAGVFMLDDEGSVIQAGAGRAVITEYVSATRVMVLVSASFAHLKIGNTEELDSLPHGKWIIAPPLETLTLPLNARPERVTLSADGKVMTDVAVGAHGVVDLPDQFCCGYVGLNFDCYAVTLPVFSQQALLEDSRKNIKEVGLSYRNSRGLAAGTVDSRFTDVFEDFTMDDTENPLPGEGVLLSTGHSSIPVSSDWDERVRIRFGANGANPTEVTSIIHVVEVGDDL